MHITQSKQKSKSNLSLGPHNPQDRRFTASEHKLHHALHYGLRHRLINFRALDIYRLAHLTAPTFYLHYRNSNHALRQYERKLISEFLSSFHTTQPSREVIFTVMLSFIYKHRSYFNATLPNHNFWLLNEMFRKIHHQLVSSNINNKCYDIYVNSLTGLIYCWNIHEKFNPDKMKFYVKKLTQTRIMDLGI